MQVSRDIVPKAMEFIKKLRGGSQAILVRADDGLIYVVKFADNPQGPNLLFNESMGAELYRACGLTVPSWKPILLTPEFLDRFPGAWMETEQGLCRPSAGLAFGSRYLGSELAQLYEMLPSAMFARIVNRLDFWLSWLLDICAGHADNRQTLFVQDGCGSLLAYFIDHGHLFGGANGVSRSHFVASQYLDSRVYPQLSSKHLANFCAILETVSVRECRRRLSCIPDEWKTATAVEGLESCLGRLADRRLVERLLDAMADAVARRNGKDERAQQHGCRVHNAVLPARIRPANALPGFAI